MSWDAPAVGARPPSLPDVPSPDGIPATSDTPALPSLPAQETQVPPLPTANVLGDVASIAPSSSAPMGSAPGDGSVQTVTTPTPRWKKRKKSKLRRLVTALVTMAVLGALAAGAVFGYQAMNPPEEPKPAVPLRDRPDTIFGQTGELVDGINEGMPDQKLLDQVLGENALNDAVNDGPEPDRD
jgi:hypothetical protein